MSADPAFWNNLAEKTVLPPPKAPMVKVFSTQALVEEMTAAGFVDIQQPDVGSKPTTAFILAIRPA